MVGERMWHLGVLTIKILFLWGCPSVNIHVGHEYLHNLCQFRVVHPHTSSADFLITNFPNTFSPVPWTSSQIFSHSTHTRSHTHTHIFLSVCLYLWPSPLPGKMSNHVYCSKVYTLEDFPLPLFFRARVPNPWDNTTGGEQWASKRSFICRSPSLAYGLNHPPSPTVRGKIVFHETVPGAKMVGDCCFRVLSEWGSSAATFPPLVEIIQILQNQLIPCRTSSQAGQHFFIPQSAGHRELLMRP